MSAADSSLWARDRRNIQVDSSFRIIRAAGQRWQVKTRAAKTGPHAQRAAKKFGYSTRLHLSVPGGGVTLQNDSAPTIVLIVNFADDNWLIHLTRRRSSAVRSPPSPYEKTKFCPCPESARTEDFVLRRCGFQFLRR